MICKDILIIDDDDYIRDLLTDFLSMEGFSCRTAATIDQAVQELNQAAKPFDLILLDRHLDNSRGEDFLTRVQSKSLETPIILLTGDHDIGSREAQEMGAKDVIHKPFSIDFLLNCIRNTMVQP